MDGDSAIGCAIEEWMQAAAAAADGLGKGDGLDEEEDGWKR